MKMKFQVAPIWWPILGLLSPIIAPWLIIKNKRFKSIEAKAEEINQKRIDEAPQIDIPEVNSLQLDVLVEWKARLGFIGDAGVSYLFKTNLGSMLFDVGFGPSNQTLLSNSKKMGFHFDQINALAISHLHMDHMGGLDASRNRKVLIPKELFPSEVRPCFLPDEANADGFNKKIIKAPQILEAGIVSTGPLARSLFMFGYTEEQALVIKLKGKGLVVFTGCGHPTIEVILKMVRKLSDEPIYAIGGGLHFPIGNGRGNKAGIQFQTIIGTGKPPWKKINISDIDRTIAAINSANPKKVFLSAHDSSDYALEYFTKKLDAETHILTAGESYLF